MTIASNVTISELLFNYLLTEKNNTYKLLILEAPKLFKLDINYL